MSDALAHDNPEPLVRSGFPAHWHATDGEAACLPDWQSIGVDVPYVILVTGRCGSTHLASLLGRSGQCGEPLEYFNEIYLPGFPEAQAARSLEEYVVRLAQSRSCNRRFGFKIDYWRWNVLRSMIDVEALLPTGRSVFFVMTRRDMVAQAYSFATARATASWHDYTDGAAEDERSHAPSDAELLRELTLVALAETGLRRYLEEAKRSALRFAYEDLLRDPGGLMRNIGKALCLRSLRAKPSARSRVRPLKYRDRDEQIASFRSRFADEIAFLEAHRERFPYDEFRTQVLDSHRIDVGDWPA